MVEAAERHHRGQQALDVRVLEATDDPRLHVKVAAACAQLGDCQVRLAADPAGDQVEVERVVARRLWRLVAVVPLDVGGGAGIGAALQDRGEQLGVGPQAGAAGQELLGLHRVEAAHLVQQQVGLAGGEQGMAPAGEVRETPAAPGAGQRPAAREHDPQGRDLAVQRFEDLEGRFELLQAPASGPELLQLLAGVKDQHHPAPERLQEPGEGP